MFRQYIPSYRPAAVSVATFLVSRPQMSALIGRFCCSVKPENRFLPLPVLLLQEAISPSLCFHNVSDLSGFISGVLSWAEPPSLICLGSGFCWRGRRTAVSRSDNTVREPPSIQPSAQANFYFLSFIVETPRRFIYLFILTPGLLLNSSWWEKKKKRQRDGFSLPANRQHPTVFLSFRCSFHRSALH